jgi:hypothetical protein
MGGDKFNGKQTKAKTVPLPYDVRASDLRPEIRTTMINWDRTFFPGEARDSVTAPQIAEWFILHTDDIAGHEEAPQFLDELKDINNRIHHVIDLRPEATYLGPCHNRPDNGNICGRQMYANPKHDTYTCAGHPGTPCGAVYNIEDRQTELLALGRDMKATLSECAAFLARFGLGVPLPTIKSWTIARPSNGVTYPARIWPTGTSANGHNLYRIGDMEELARERLTKKTRRRQPA